MAVVRLTKDFIVNAASVFLKGKRASDPDAPNALVAFLVKAADSPEYYARANIVLNHDERIAGYIEEVRQQTLEAESSPQQDVDFETRRQMEIEIRRKLTPIIRAEFESTARQETETQNLEERRLDMREIKALNEQTIAELQEVRKENARMAGDLQDVLDQNTKLIDQNGLTNENLNLVIKKLNDAENARDDARKDVGALKMQIEKGEAQRKSDSAREFKINIAIGIVSVLLGAAGAAAVLLGAVSFVVGAAATVFAGGAGIAHYLGLFSIHNSTTAGVVVLKPQVEGQKKVSVASPPTLNPDMENSPAPSDDKKVAAPNNGTAPELYKQEQRLTVVSQEKSEVSYVRPRMNTIRYVRALAQIRR